MRHREGLTSLNPNSKSSAEKPPLPPEHDANCFVGRPPRPFTALKRRCFFCHPEPLRALLEGHLLRLLADLTPSSFL